MQKANKKTVLVVAALLLGAISFAATSQVNNVITFGSYVLGFGTGEPLTNTSPSVIPATNGANIKTLFAYCASNGYSTPSEIGSGADYVAGGNGFLALEIKALNKAGSTVLVDVGTATNGVGLNSATPPTGLKLFYNTYILTTQVTVDSVRWKVPAGMYLYVYCSTSPGTLQISGVEL